MKPRQVYWTQTARIDLDTIIYHIAADSPTNGLAVLDRLEQKACSLSTQSSRGRAVPELQAVGVSHYRELIARPWRIIYRQYNGNIYVMAVLDSRRDIEDLLLQRLVRG